MTKKFAFLIVAAMGFSAPAYAQSVRIITGDIEHVYGPGGRLLDDDALRARNERAKILSLREREDAMRQQEIDAAAAKAAAATATAYDEPYGWQDDGSYDVGTFRSRHNRHINLQRMSTFGAVSRNSLQFRHANARVRR
jgi:hypothetical protein